MPFDKLREAKTYERRIVTGFFQSAEELRLALAKFLSYVQAAQQDPTIVTFIAEHTTEEERQRLQAAQTWAAQTLTDFKALNLIVLPQDLDNV